MNPPDIVGVNDIVLVIENDLLDQDDVAIEETTTGIKNSIDPDPPRRSGLQ